MDVLEDIQADAPAEKALLRWSRASRFAGSKDRAAVRDHVYDVMRQKRSLAVLGGGTSGRHLIIGLLRAEGADVQAIFSGEGYAPDRLDAEEIAWNPPPLTDAEAANLRDDIWPLWQAALGPEAVSAARIAQQRGPATVRVVTGNATRHEVGKALALDGIETRVVEGCDTALILTSNARRLTHSKAFRDGWLEVQDAASQIAVDRLDMKPRAKVLDYCAGGGGKALAIADQHNALVFAHDSDYGRMSDIETRAKRTGQTIRCLRTDEVQSAGPYDVVFVDAPCSGSGTWRRNPDQKWRCSADDVNEFQRTQLEILEEASTYLQPSGKLYYATCSVFLEENQRVVAHFLASKTNFQLLDELSLIPHADHDGFYLAALTT